MKTEATFDESTADAGVLQALDIRIAPAPVTPLYRLGLALVAVAMLLLPILYIGLIALAAYGIWLHLNRDTWLLDAGRYGPALYVIPLLAGPLMILFLVKPLLARRGRGAAPRSLDRAKEPLLFAFVERLCRAVGAIFIVLVVVAVLNGKESPPWPTLEPVAVRFAEAWNGSRVADVVGFFPADDRRQAEGSLRYGMKKHGWVPALPAIGGPQDVTSPSKNRCRVSFPLTGGGAGELRTTWERRNGAWVLLTIQPPE